MFLNQWQVGFYNHLQQYNSAGLLDSLVQFVTIVSAYVFTSGYQTYLHMSLEIEWRRWLTGKYITLWLRNKTYYRLNLINLTINPDQRISEDIRLFITSTLDLSLGLLRHAVMLLVFSAVLWRLSGIITFSVAHRVVAIPGYLCWLALLYSAFGTWFIIKVGKSLVDRNIIQQSNEAEFRACLSRIKDADEGVALYGGEKAEEITLLTYFKKIINNYRSIIKYTKTVTFISTAYSQLSIVFAFLIAAPRYFNHDLQLGQLFEISGAYWYVHSALSYIIDSFNKIALWKAVAIRLDTFRLQMAKIDRPDTCKGNITHASPNQLKLKNLTVLSLNNQVLVDNLSLTLNAQDSLLINGPTGCGKTTLLRTIAGIWPYFSGKIVKPTTKTMMFLPQKSYIPAGSLRNALLYPNRIKNLPDTELNKALARCNLSALTGKLDQSKDWGKTLSLGEQQCLAFVRVMLERPEWLFLDEATANMGKQTEQSLYLLLKETMPNLTIVSVGHKETLRPFHTLNLTVDNSGLWNITALRKP